MSERTEMGSSQSNQPLESRGSRRAFLHLRWWFLAAAWMGLIFFLSAQPDFRVVPDEWQAEPLSLAAHALEYGVLALLLYAAARATPGLARHAWQVALLLAVLYAASDELHQVFVPGRVADWRDIAADAIGALLALAAARYFFPGSLDDRTG